MTFRSISQAPDIRGSIRVIPHDRGTRGIKMEYYGNNDKLNNTLLQGATTLVGEQEEKQSQNNLKTKAVKDHPQGDKKIRRYSGAARRRFKKQLEKERMERKNQSITSNSTGEDKKRDEIEEVSPFNKRPRMNDNSLNSSMEYLCKESEVNDQKTSSSNAQVTYEVGPFRMSKFSRLNDNIPNLSMDHLCKGCEDNDQETSNSNAQVTSEVDPSKVSKCSRLDDNILNLCMDYLCKGCEDNDQEAPNSNAQTTYNFFIIMKHPERKLTNNEVSTVRRLVMKHVLSMSKDARFPRFYSNTEWNGAIFFNCANKETGEWLSNLTPELILDDGVQLRILDIDELSKGHLATVHVNDSEITIKDVLFLLENQNEGLVTNDWIIFGSENRDAKSPFIVYFRDTSLEVLKALEFRPFCGLGRAVIKLRERKDSDDEIENEKASTPHLNKPATEVPRLF